MTYQNPDQTIDLTVAQGSVVLTLPRTLKSSTDITADTVDVALGTLTEPGIWQAPDSRNTTSDPVKGVYTVAVAMLIGGTVKPAAGDYWLWVRLHDGTQVIPAITTGRIRIVA